VPESTELPEIAQPEIARPEIVCLCGSMRFAEEFRAAQRKAFLGELHLRKIDLADRVVVINPGGYVGESTQREIAYARAAGKPVAFTHPV